MVDRLHKKKTQNVKLLLDPWIRALDSIFDHPNTIYPAVKSLSHPVHKERPGAGLADKRLIILSEASTRSDLGNRDLCKCPSTIRSRRTKNQYC